MDEKKNRKPNTFHNINSRNLKIIISHFPKRVFMNIHSEKEKKKTNQPTRLNINGNEKNERMLTTFM